MNVNYNSQTLGFPATSLGYWREGHSSFWRLSYQPLHLCSMNSFSISVVIQFSLSRPCSSWLFQFCLVCFTGKSQQVSLFFTPQCTANTEPFHTEHFSKCLVMKEGSHITREETIKARSQTARRWHSSSTFWRQWLTASSLSAATCFHGSGPRSFP